MLIYAIRNRINGKHYIGKTERTLEQRWQVHVSTARQGCGCPYLGAAIRKYGPEAFQRTVLFYAEDKAELDAAERAYILAFRSNEPDRGYNLTLGGEGMAGFKHTDATRRKMSASHLGKPAPKSAEHRRNLSVAHMGKKLSDEHKRGIASATQGERNPNAKLTAAQVSEIREEFAFNDDISRGELAAKYGVSRCNITDIVRYSTWTEGTDPNLRVGNPRDKLTFAQVSELREDYAFSEITQAALAAKYGVLANTVSRIVNHKCRQLSKECSLEQ